MADAVVESVRDVRRDGITAVLGAWLIVGLFLDGYVHNTRGDQLESFFTPWHGVLYTGSSRRPCGLPADAPGAGTGTDPVHGIA